ncbi:MAG: DUF1294 domain-containing protein [Bacteroides sp.]
MIYYIAGAWLVMINIAAFAAYGLDKRKAVKHAWRIPEATLIGLAVLGGSIGAYAGMKVFHHKTLHLKFRIGIPVIFIVQLFAVLFIWLRLIHKA